MVRVESFVSNFPPVPVCVSQFRCTVSPVFRVAACFCLQLQSRPLDDPLFALSHGNRIHKIQTVDVQMLSAALVKLVSREGSLLCASCKEYALSAPRPDPASPFEGLFNRASPPIVPVGPKGMDSNGGFGMRKMTTYRSATLLQKPPAWVSGARLVG